MWLNEISMALDRASRPVTFFFRDDDAGWGDEQLFTLLDLCDARRTPIDLAVIPQALTRELALELCARRARARARLGLHQHGYTHANHERSGRKCEFGATRTAAQQARDITAGRLRLQALLGATDPIFTPPWNRCTQATVDALAENGISVLSRDHRARALALGALAELPVHVDWCKWRDPAAPDWAVLDQTIAAAVQHESADHARVGVMLHHAVMGAADWQALGALLALLNQHPQAQCRLMRDVICAKTRPEVRAPSPRATGSLNGAPLSPR